MANLSFFQKKISTLTLSEIINLTKSEPLGFDSTKKSTSEIKISGVATLSNCKSDEISFFHSPRYLSDFLSSKTEFCFASKDFAGKQPSSMTILAHENPYFAYSLTASAFYEQIKPDFSDHKTIHSSAKIGKNCQIANSAFIGKNVIIGDDCIIEPSAVILNGCAIGNNCFIGANSTISFAIIGDNCKIFNGVQIGQDGFGYVYHAGKNHKVLQLGIVEIGNNVEIGANSCIDRGAIDNTIIADDVKIDNLCQIAHNVEIGQGTVIAGGAGIAGSTKIGRFVQIGGNCGIAGHISIGDGVKIAGMSGVMRDIEPKSVMAGIPVLPITKWHRLNAMFGKMLEKVGN